MIVTKLGAIDIGSNSVRCLIVNVIFKEVIPITKGKHDTLTCSL